MHFFTIIHCPETPMNTIKHTRRYKLDLRLTREVQDGYSYGP